MSSHFFFPYTFFYSQGGRSNYILCQVYARSLDNRCLHFCAVVCTGFIVPCFAFEFGIRSLSFKIGTSERCYLNILFELRFGLAVRRQKWDCIYFNNYVWRFANQFKTFNGYFVCITFINQLCSHVSMYVKHYQKLHNYEDRHLQLLKPMYSVTEIVIY